MNKKYGCLIFTLIIFGIVLFQQKYISSKLHSYVCAKAEKRFGTKSLNKEQEEKIKVIANRMGVFEPIVIRKASPMALITFGYHNAFICFPALFDFIPMNTQPYLFVSEGFFEDLSPEEQLFLVGHEMVHIKERHTKYESLVFFILALFFLVLWWILKKQLRLLFKKHIHSKKYFFILFIMQGILLYICLAIPNLTFFVYKKHIERIADCKSMEILRSYDGAIKLVDRWIKEFNMPEHNPFFGLFSDHPSCAERKACCLELKNKFEKKA